MRRLLVDVSPLRISRAFAALWIGTSFAGLGSQIATVAVLAHMWELTRSPLWTGAIGLATAIPILVLGPVGGSLADRLDRRSIVRVTTLLQVLSAGALTWQAAMHNQSPVVLLALVAANAAVGALGAPARRTLPVRLLQPGRLGAGLALQNLSFQFAMLAGPAIGGILAAWAIPVRVRRATPHRARFAGIPRLPATAAAGTGRGSRSRTVSFARERLGAGHPQGHAPRGVRERHRRDSPGDADRRVPPRRRSILRRRPTHPRPLPLSDRGRRPQRGPAVRQDHTHPAHRTPHARRGDDLGTRDHRFRPDRLALGGAFLALAIAGAADTIAVISRGVLVQLEAPDHARGRISAVEQVVGVAAPEIGNFRGGVLAALIGAPASIITGGVSATLATALIAWTHKSARAYEAPAENPE